ncbi:MAG: cell division protein ZapA [Clostridia bacterium]|jgi:cell division protein ZapA (FtsZ GTPase activity inhibitor)|nr:cell division protein ZapA [Clostridia bacterium]
MEKINHTVKVAGFTFKVVSEDSSEYMSQLAREVDLKIDALLKNSTISTTQAAVAIALDYADTVKKNDSSTENLKTQLKESLQDVANARKEADFYKRELERLQGSKLEENKENPALW